MDLRATLQPLTDRLATEPVVQAVTVVGSHASGFATPASDIDLFVYVDDTPPDQVLEMRNAVAAELADPAKRCVVAQAAHPYADVFVINGTAVWIDLMFWTRQWAEDELDWRLEKQSPQAGYSTAFWRSIRDGLPLFERDDWHRRLQQRARSPYPDLLRERIIAMNRDLLGRDNPFSFLNQVDRAVAERDLVAVQHRVAKWLASYFDVLFAANRVLGPGEKRLIAFARQECESLPEAFADDVNAVVGMSCDPSERLVAHMELMLERLDG